MGETFGGYWGQMPDSVLKPGKSRDERTYTLKSIPTMPPTTTTRRITTTLSTTATTTPKNIDEDNSAEREKEIYLTVELPILNVSARVVPGRIDQDSLFTTEDTFDLIYDVAPRVGQTYETKEVPLLEVKVKETKGSGRYGGNDDEDGSMAEFQVALNDMFTPDPRLLLSDSAERTYKKKSYKYHPNVNRRLDFKKNKNFFIPKGVLYRKRPSFTNRRPQLNTVQPNNYVSKLYDVKHQHNYANEENNTDQKPNYWDAIHDILKNLSQSSDVSTEPPHKELVNFLRGISNKKINESVYLNPDLAYIDLNSPEVPVIEHVSLATGEQPAEYKYRSMTQDLDKSFNTSNGGVSNNSATNNDNGATLALLPLALDVDSIVLNVTNLNKDGLQDKQSKTVLGINSSPSVIKRDPISVSLVDHESFDNVVQSASIMAIKLNQTKATSPHKTILEGHVTKQSKRRKKRYLYAIDIAEAKPHPMQVMKHRTTTSAPETLDISKLQRLIELQDDEIHDRVAMRYLPQYLGPPLLNFCDFNKTSTRYVYLFNSSRLVLALSNFTLRSMTVVVTPARTLLRSDARCGPTYLECQVSGTRVCIDSLCACDGVPNCGSYDIYDEDRLSCGAAAGFRHNVCLAAITFLAVLLTMLYTVHYWLKRCVPKVSDAFFIYTDAAENVLYLDSVMKSPHDIGVAKDFFRGVQEFLEHGDDTKKKNVFTRIYNTCMRFFRRNKPSEEEVVTADFDQLYSERISTLAEMEINKMPSSQSYLTDAAVQTSSSLQEELVTLSPIYSRDEDFGSANLMTTSIDFGQVDSDSTQPSDELNMLQFLRKLRGRSISMQQSMVNEELDQLPNKPRVSSLKPPSNEKGMHSIKNEEDIYKTEAKVIIEQPQVSKKPSFIDKTDKPAVKHLRFKDETLVISHKEDELEDDAIETLNNPRRSIVLGASKVFRIQEPDNEPNEAEELSTGTGRELKSYFNWGSGKEKKKKKPNKKK